MTAAEAVGLARAATQGEFTTNPAAAVRRVVGWTWYPVLFAVVFVAEPFARLDVELASAQRILIVTVVISVVVTLITTRLAGRERGAVISLLVILGLIGATTFGKAFLLVVAIWLVLFERYQWNEGRLRIRIPWPRITEIFSIFLAVMLVFQVVRAVNVRLSSPTVAVPAAWHLAAPVQGPDMYVLLADGHGRGDVMANGYGEDETELRSTLTSLGFDEATHSRANHVLTRFSVSVLFNGRPMSEMGQDLSRPVDEALPFAALRTSGASPLLRSAGYRVIVVGSGFEHLGLRGVDTFIDVGPRNEMEEVMLEGTALGQAIDKLTAGYVRDIYTRTLHELDTMTSIARQPAGQPRFVFAHLPAPHWPMVFNADCSFRPVDHYTRAADDRGYRKADASGLRIERDQTACVDTLLARTVNDVVAADPDAVVIVLSDHGPEEKLDWTAPDEPGLSDRFANLFWARTPGRPGLFPDDITLVNVLPILFNSYLGSDLPLHPNDLWFGPAPGNDRFVRYAPPSS